LRQTIHGTRCGGESANGGLQTAYLLLNVGDVGLGYRHVTFGGCCEGSEEERGGDDERSEADHCDEGEERARERVDGSELVEGTSYMFLGDMRHAAYVSTSRKRSHRVKKLGRDFRGFGENKEIRRHHLSLG
jgi:hypothetical protein